jgi:hypothetical protein
MFELDAALRGLLLKDTIVARYGWCERILLFVRIMILIDVVPGASLSGLP